MKGPREPRRGVNHGVTEPFGRTEVHGKEWMEIDGLGVLRGRRSLNEPTLVPLHSVYNCSSPFLRGEHPSSSSKEAAK
jgi:hypothetical protein